MMDEVRSGVGFNSLPNTAMFTPSQLLVASQTAALMAASGLGMPGANHAAAFFHPGLFASWGAAAAAAAATATSPHQSSPPSPSSPLGHGQLSPAALALRKHNNNNNVVTSSSTDVAQTVVRAPKRRYRKTNEEPQQTVATDIVPLSPPTSTGGEVPCAREPVTANRDKQFTCGVCSRSFGYKHVLQNHERTHTGEKPFECPECHKRFTRDHHLKTHMRLHTGERPYHCEYCDRQFVQVANLRRHLRVHTGERPYACQYCTARFSDSNQLKAHVLIHKGEKPFGCDRCFGRFRRRHHLLHHKCTVAVAATKTGARTPVVQAGSLESCSPPASDLSDDLASYMIGDELATTTTTSRPREARSVAREPLVSLPLRGALPEQTEPEDLSMSTGLHSHSSGDSPRSRSPASLCDDPDDYELDDAASLFLQRRPTTAATISS